MNEKIFLNAALSLEGAKQPESPAKFRIVANTGALMYFGGDAVVVDLDGIETPNNKEIPVIYSHDYEEGIGHTTKHYKADNAYIVEGVVSRLGEKAADFVNSARLGFPWQASIGGYVTDKIELRDDETLEVNGRIIEGPALVATRFELYEVSVVEYGADDETESKIIAKKEFELMSEKKELEKEREKIALELERVAEIKKRANGGSEELQAKAIREGWTPDQFELEVLRASRPLPPAVHHPVQDVDGKALEAAAVRAAGFSVDEKRYTEQQLTAADTMRGIDFLELCERASNAERYSFRKDSYRKVCAALSTGNLGSVLTNVANAVLLRAFDTSDVGWRQVFKISSVSDFKTAERWKIDSNFKFKEVPEGAEIEHATVADEKFEIKAKMWGRQFALSEQAIVNGDALGVFGDLLRQISYGANEAINDEAWGLFLNPAKTSDGKDFYSTEHGSLKASCPLTLENLSAARSAFITRKKGKSTTVDNNSPLGIPPALLVVPSALEDQALALVHSTMINNGTAANTPADFNPNYNRFRVVAIPYLGFTTFTNASDTSWYLIADPNRLPAFEIAFLNGAQAPIIRQDQMRIGRLGVEFDAHCAWGVAQEDYRGALKATA